MEVLYLCRYLFLKAAENSRSELHLGIKTKLVKFHKKAMLCALEIGNISLSILQQEKLNYSKGTLLSQPSSKEISTKIPNVKA